MLLLRTLGLGDLSLCTAHAQHSVCNHAPRTSTKTLIKQSTRSVSSSSSNMPCSIAVDCNPYWAMQLIRTHLVPHSSPVRFDECLQDSTFVQNVSKHGCTKLYFCPNSTLYRLCGTFYDLHCSTVRISHNSCSRLYFNLVCHMNQEWR